MIASFFGRTLRAASPRPAKSLPLARYSSAAQPSAAPAATAPAGAAPAPFFGAKTEFEQHVTSTVNKHLAAILWRSSIVVGGAAVAAVVYLGGEIKAGNNKLDQVLLALVSSKLTTQEALVVAVRVLSAPRIAGAGTAATQSQE